MNLTALSDTHGYHLLPKRAEVLIYAGDYSAIGSYTESVIFAKKLQEVKAKKIIAIPGNHDYFPVDLCIEDYIEYNGVTFFTSPYTVDFNGWNFMESEQELEARMWRWPSDVNVLITHGPPYGILDNGCGSKALREYVERVNPHVHIFGHIHNAHGHRKLGTNFYNVSLLNDDYKPTNALTEIKL